MSKKKDVVGVMDSAARETEGTEAAGKRRIGPKQVIDPFTKEWRDENKQERFKRLVEQRMTNLLRRFRQVRLLANKQQYSYTTEDAGKVIDTLHEAVDAVRQAFAGGRQAQTGFKL